MNTIFLQILFFLSAIFILARSGTWAVQALSRIARFLKWSEFMVAFILVALVSSLPELFVGISSAIHNIPEVSFGNIIGANVIHLTVAIGLAVILSGGLDVEKKIVRRDSVFTVFSALLPLILILDKELSRTDGVVLLSGFAVYLLWLFSQKERFSKLYNNADHSFSHFLRDIFVFLISVMLLFLSAEFIIWSAVAFARAIHLSPVIVGVLVIGAGTALPEAYFAVKAAIQRRRGMILGDLMGSIVVTSLLVLGFVAVLSPIKISDFSPYLIARSFLLISAALFLIFIRTGERITKREAFLLMFVYAAFVTAEIFSQ